MVVLYTVIAVRLKFIFWTALLKRSLGYLISNPSMKRSGEIIWKMFLPDLALQCADGIASRQYLDPLRTSLPVMHKFVRSMGMRIGGNSKHSWYNVRDEDALFGLARADTYGITAKCRIETSYYDRYDKLIRVINNTLPDMKVEKNLN